MSFSWAKVGIELIRFYSTRGLAISLIVTALVLTSPLSFGAWDDTVSGLREKVDRAERERVEICKILGAVYEAAGDSDKAIECYRMGFQVFPDDPFLCSKLMELCTSKERWAELVPVYESLVNANPGANEPYMKKLVECHLKVGQIDEAVAVVNEMLGEYGDDSTDYRDIAHLFMSYEQYEAAAQVCRKGIDAGTGQNRDLYCLLGRALAKTGKYSEAVAAYGKALEMSTSQRDKRILEEELAELCKEGTVIENILREKMESLQVLDQQLVELYWEKAHQEDTGGNLEAAIAFYRKVISILPDSERARQAQERILKLEAP